MTSPLLVHKYSKNELRGKKHLSVSNIIQIFYFIPNRFLALLIQIGFTILFFASNAIWDLDLEIEIENFYRYVTNSLDINSLDKYEN